MKRFSWLMLWCASGCSDGAPMEPCAPPPAPSAGAPFIDATSDLGIDAAHHLETDFCELPDTGAGPGVCLLDADGDDDLDIYFVDRAGFDNRMYRNDGGAFSEITADSGAALTGAQSMGCLAFDYDADGDTDLYVTNLGQDVLLENDQGVFRDVSDDVGLDADGFSVSATAGDFDGDGDLDLFVGRLADYSTCPDGCEASPNDCTPEPNLLFENRDGQLVEVSAERGIDDLGPTLAPLFVDFEPDGDLDLYVGNDIGLVFPDRMYINDGSGYFEDRAESMSVHGPGTDTMGIDVGDYDLDGHFDMAITDFDRRPIRLFRCFDPMLPCSNEVAPEGTDYVKWGIALADFDHDRDLDLFTTTGTVFPDTPGDPSYLYFNDGKGGFEQYLPPDDTGLGKRQISRGAAFGDLDGDGDIDVVIANAGDAHQVLLNQSAAGHHLMVALDSQAAGATVRVDSAGGGISEQQMIGGSFASTSDPRLHFGLGNDCRADVTVTYLDGATKTTSASAGQTIRISR